MVKKPRAIDDEMEPGASRIEDAILPLVLPADATSLHVHPISRAMHLRASGLPVDTQDADVELGPLTELTSAADSAVIDLLVDPVARDARPRWVRVGHRVVRHVHLKVLIAQTRWALARMGYRGGTTAYAWDKGHWLRERSLVTDHAARGWVERLPQQAVVLGWRGADRPRLLTRVLRDAADATSIPTLAPQRMLIKAGMLIVLTERHVVRIAVGPAKGRIENQHAALTALLARNPDEQVRRLVPWPVTRGVSGMATWSIEPRLPGRTASPVLTDTAAAQAVDFLVGLASLHHPQPDTGRLGEAAAFLAAVATPAQERLLHELAARTEDILSGFPRGFGHGDFFHGNLLIDGGSLSGVIDWDTSGPGRLPLVDLLHLHIHTVQQRRAAQWGHTIVRDLLPWAAAGGDRAVRTYLERIGLRCTPLELRAFVTAYWIERLAYQLRTYADRRARPRWMADNFSTVLDALIMPAAPQHW